MIWNDNIEVTKPQDSGERVSLGASRIRTFKRAVCERLEGLIYGFVSDDSENDKSKKGFWKVLLNSSTSSPQHEDNKGIIYTKNINGKIELFYKNNIGNEKQLTTDGKLNIVNEEDINAVLLEGTQTINGIKTFSSCPVLSSNPVNDNDATPKSYVDTKLSKNISGEVNAFTAKSNPVNSDIFLIEDSENNWAKKKITVQNLLDMTKIDYHIGSDAIRHNNEPEKQTYSTTWVKMKEIKVQIPKAYTYRIAFDACSVTSDHVGYHRIYKNNQAYGNIRQHIGTSWATYTQDLYFEPNDYIQLYSYSTDGGRWVKVRNFRILESKALRHMFVYDFFNTVI